MILPKHCDVFPEASQSFFKGMEKAGFFVNRRGWKAISRLRRFSEIKTGEASLVFAFEIAFQGVH